LKNSVSVVEMSEYPKLIEKEQGENLLKLIEAPLELISRNNNEEINFRSILKNVTSLSTIKDTIKDSSR